MNRQKFLEILQSYGLTNYALCQYLILCNKPLNLVQAFIYLLPQETIGELLHERCCFYEINYITAPNGAQIFF